MIYYPTRRSFTEAALAARNLTQTKQKEGYTVVGCYPGILLGVRVRYLTHTGELFGGTNKSRPTFTGVNEVFHWMRRTRTTSLSAAAALLFVVAGRSASAFLTSAHAFPGRTFVTRVGSVTGDGIEVSVDADSVISAEDDSVVAGIPADEQVQEAADSGSRNKKLSVLVCPAQFCVPADYEELLGAIREEASEDVEIVVTATAPLSRNDWIKVARQLPTKSFIEANLSVKITLDWYFQAIEDGIADLLSRGGGDTDILIVGHSIGGWVARAYLGGLSGSSTAVYRTARDRITGLLTLGTPHSSPEGALVDQTRGLLRAIESSEDCSPRSLADRGVRITCVGSSGVGGGIVPKNLEEVVAAASYLPLTGKLGQRGDGITPIDLAFLDEPARRVEIERCELTDSPVSHAHVLPTPWNLWDGSAASIGLPKDVVWYGSPGVLRQWIEFVR